ncbi:MAG: hypothetical protein P4L99_20560 [Chthoniobacter sp.]|nr:hypothetical protein [Chthoniobacter sp.]
MKWNVAPLSTSASAQIRPPWQWMMRETAAEIRDRTLEAARYIPIEQLGTTDDCGFSPFCDDISTTRDTAFAKIRARVEGTALAAAVINGG